MSDIFREVDEALQQDKLIAIWEEYRNTIIAAIAILLLSTMLTTSYKKWDAKRDAAETEKLTTALSSDNPQTAIQNVIEDTRKGHAALGLMTAANMYMQDGKTDDAAAIYKQIVDNKKSPRNIRDLARILYVQNTQDADINILKPLLSNDKSPWIWHARIEAAVVSAHKDADYKTALSYLEKFEEASYIPSTLKQRGLALAHVYALKQKEQSAEQVTEAE